MPTQGPRADRPQPRCAASSRSRRLRAFTSRRTGCCRGSVDAFWDMLVNIGAEGRDIRPLGDFDADRIVLPGCQIVALQRAPQPAGLYSDNGIGLRIEARLPSEHRCGNAVRLYALGAPGQRFLDDVLQEPAIALGCVEFPTIRHTLHLRPHCFGRAAAIRSSISPLPVITRASRGADVFLPDVSLFVRYRTKSTDAGPSSIRVTSATVIYRYVLLHRSISAPLMNRSGA